MLECKYRQSPFCEAPHQLYTKCEFGYERGPSLCRVVLT